MRLKSTIATVAVAAGVLMGMTATMAAASASTTSRSAGAAASTSYSYFCNYVDANPADGPAGCAAWEGNFAYAEIVPESTEYLTNFEYNGAQLRDRSGDCLQATTSGVIMTGCDGVQGQDWSVGPGLYCSTGTCEVNEYEVTLDGSVQCLEGDEQVPFSDLTTGSCPARYDGEFWGFY